MKISYSTLHSHKIFRFRDLFLLGSANEADPVSKFPSNNSDFKENGVLFIKVNQC